MGAEIQITSVNILAVGTTSLSYFFPSSLTSNVSVFLILCFG